MGRRGRTARCPREVVDVHNGGADARARVHSVNHALAVRGPEHEKVVVWGQRARDVVDGGCRLAGDAVKDAADADEAREGAENEGKEHARAAHKVDHALQSTCAGHAGYRVEHATPEARQPR